MRDPLSKSPHSPPICFPGSSVCWAATTEPGSARPAPYSGVPYGSTNRSWSVSAPVRLWSFQLRLKTRPSSTHIQPRPILSRRSWRVVIVNHARLSLTQFQKALTAANLHFSLIRKKYPHLRAYLVLSVLGEQTKIDSSLEQMIDEFPDLLADGTSKTRMQDFLKAPLPEKPTEAQKQQRQDQFQELAEALEFVGKTQIEIRFHHLDYELIWNLQSDDLVNRELTPQTKASINIVLGTIFDFEKDVLEP